MRKDNNVPSPRTKVTDISRELMGKIVDEVFDGAVEDVRVIEEIYAVIKRHEAGSHKPLLTCQCANSKTDPCIVCGKGKTLVTTEWMQKMAAREGEHDPTTGPLTPQSNLKGYPVKDEHLRYWRVWWKGNGPKRGDYIMQASMFDIGYEREIAYIGDQRNGVAISLVHLHNLTVDRLRTSLSIVTEARSD